MHNAVEISALKLGELDDGPRTPDGIRAMEAIADRLSKSGALGKQFSERRTNASDQAAVLNIDWAASGEPVTHASIEYDPATQRFYRHYPVGWWVSGGKQSERHLFRDADDAFNYLCFILKNAEF